MALSLSCTYNMDLSFFVWNCQGAASPGFHRTLQSLLQGYKPDILVLVEPRIVGVQADKAIRRIGYPFSHRVEARGFSGGIWLLWKDKVNVEVLVNHRQFIHVRVCSTPGAVPCLFTAVYGSPTPTLREKLWEDLLQLPPLQWLGSWLVILMPPSVPRNEAGVRQG